MTIYLQRQPNGDLIDWGRHRPAKHGPTWHYTGEAAEVMRLVLKHARAK